jgi:hypothetical protein
MRIEASSPDRLASGACSRAVQSHTRKAIIMGVHATDVVLNDYRKAHGIVVKGNRASKRAAGGVLT